MIADIGKSEKVARCAPIATQPATFDHTNATSSATKSATLPLKALAHKVLDRNSKRNQAATSGENRRNFCPQKSTQKLRSKSHYFPVEILEKACTNLTLKPQQLWRFLSEDDIEGLRAGDISFDTLRSYAERWNDYPYLVPVGNDLSYPETPTPKTVSCGDCRHFKPDTIGDGRGIGACEKGLTGNHGKPLFPKTKRLCGSFE